MNVDQIQPSIIHHALLFFQLYSYYLIQFVGACRLTDNFDFSKDSMCGRKNNKNKHNFLIFTNISFLTLLIVGL